tara:strand:+ start:718 stop:1365 length:648 start_codon:yes stop_codon:yes gene_type:complete
MKAALLLPGHVRAYKETFQNQFETIIKPNNCDVYISTSTTKTVVRGNDISSVKYGKEDLEAELKEFYGDLLLGIFVEEETEEDVKASTRDRHPDRSKQWLRLQQCNQMAKQSGVQYDFVIRSRTDLVFSRGIALSEDMPETIYLMRHFDPKISIHDQFAFGVPELMDKYCKLYDNFAPEKDAGRSEEQLYNMLLQKQVPLTFIQQMVRFEMIRGC